MIFQHTIDEVMNFRKTQTRRVVGDREYAVRSRYNQIIEIVHNDRVKWRVGQSYAVQPGRGQAQIARIKITKITCERLSRISTKDAIAEGFASRREFLATWEKIHGIGSTNRRVWVIAFEVTGIKVLMPSQVAIPETLSHVAG